MKRQSFLLTLCMLFLISISCDKEKKEVGCGMCDEMSHYKELCDLDKGDDDYYDKDEEEDDEDDDDKMYDEKWGEKTIIEPLEKDPTCQYFVSGLVKFTYDEYDKDDDKDEYDKYENDKDDREVVFFVEYYEDGWGVKKKVIYDGCKDDEGKTVFCCKFKQECIQDVSRESTKKDVKVDKSVN